jgi:deoxyribose-phosphate aldolase
MTTVEARTTRSPRNTVTYPAPDGAPPVGHLPRNPGMPLDLAWVREVRVNRSAVERRAATIPTRRSIKTAWQAGWLLRAVTLMDLTTLQGDDTPGRVRRLCAKARHPVRADLLEALGMLGGVSSRGSEATEGSIRSEPVPRLRDSPQANRFARDDSIHVAAVCVYHAFVETAVQALEGSGIPVAAVSTGFPAGLSPMKTRLAEIEASVADGAEEIDIVITRAHVLTGNWQALYDEIRAFREACGAAHLKAILGTGELATLRDVGRASMVAMMAGADFIKTSTGKETVNAILPVGIVMARAIRAYRERTGFLVGFKPAGGIRTAKQSLDWLAMIKEELGDRWLRPDLFRFGASSLLTDIERQLEHYVTGRYSAAHRHPMA